MILPALPAPTRRVSLHAVLVAVWSLTCVPAASAQPTAGAATFAPYSLRSYDGQVHDIELGTLVVPESRAKPDGATVRLAFFRLKSSAPNPGAPIVFLMGGPGIAVSLIAPIPPYWQLFDALRAAGDVILLEQRGLGLSSPKADCPALPQPLDTTFLTSQASFIAGYRHGIAACAAHWRARGVDPRAFSDAAIADDVDDIRRALGAPRVSLLGFSYGSRLAMTFARRHPDRLERVVLQGPIDADLAYRASATLDPIFEHYAQLAAADSVTAPFAQNLVARTRALFARADRAPFGVRIRRASGDSVTIPVGREALQGLVLGHVVDVRIPALVETVEHGDLAILTRWVEGMYNDFSAGAGTLMGRALACSAGPSPARRAVVDAGASRSIFGPAFDNFAADAAFCDGLGGSVPTASPRVHPKLQTPALFITGEFDHRTPVGNDEVLASEFAESVRLVVENGGHELLPGRAVREVVVDFFLGRDVRGRALRESPPRFLSIEDAKRPPLPGGRL